MHATLKYEYSSGEGKGIPAYIVRYLGFRVFAYTKVYSINIWPVHCVSRVYSISVLKHGMDFVVRLESSWLLTTSGSIPRQVGEPLGRPQKYPSVWESKGAVIAGSV
jgi:hypothetical protein